MNATITLRDVSIGYGNNVIASHLDAHLYASELVCLIGSNGVGKSTLLRTIAGFQPPLSSALDVRKEDIGIVLTEKPDVRQLSVKDIIGLGRSAFTDFFGTLKDDDVAVINRAMEMTNISHLSNRNFAHLSDGEKQKVMIAKTLAQMTPIILLDEPTAFLDYPSKIELLSLLKHLAHEEGKSILFSTHDVELALGAVDTVWFMDASSGLYTCTPSEIQLSSQPPYISLIR
ncbi:MAG: ABC transporter ATP-binding protein [Prevotella sp.]|nr:ABC transporter ATP-binding protein [Candidatus Equicola faecalis]